VDREIADKYDGDASAIWSDGVGVEEVKARAGELPGFGDAKTETLVHALDFSDTETLRKWVNDAASPRDRSRALPGRDWRKVKGAAVLAEPQC
jgi:hypothetical protein